MYHDLIVGSVCCIVVERMPYKHEVMEFESLQVLGFSSYLLLSMSLFLSTCP